jgi:hypothetical protein
MSGPVREWGLWAIVGAAAGLALGLAVGWFWPVTYTNTPPAALRQDYHDDYVVMVAAAYEVEGDLDRARERLALLAPEDPAAPVVELGERLVEAGGRADDIARLARLAWSLDALTPTLVPYLEGGL